MSYLRTISRLPKRILARVDRAITSTVSWADDGVVGFVERVERVCGRIFRVARRDERRVIRTAEKAEQAVSRTSRTLFGQITAEVTSLAGAVFGAPGRLGRAIEALVAYWAVGLWHFLGRVAQWLTAPIRKRVSGHAKRQALESITMTPDHRAHWELLALAAVAVLLVAGTVLLFGKDLGIRQPNLVKLDGLLALPSWAWHKVLTSSPLRLTVLLSVVALVLAAIVFWLRMVRDSYRREYPTAVEQTQWRLVTVFLFIPGAVLYFFKQYNRLGFRKYAARHVVSLIVTGVTVLVATSTYGTLWYFNQKAEADVAGAGYRAPAVNLDPNQRREVLSRDQYGEPLKPATTSRRDPFAPIPGENASPSPSPSPSPSANPRP